MTMITLHHLSLGHYAPSGGGGQTNKLSPKQSPPNSHNDLKKDDVQLLLSKCIYSAVHLMTRWDLE